MCSIIHSNPVLRVAATSELCEETTVSSLKDVNFWVSQLRVVLGIDGPVLLSDMACHDWCAMGRIFTVKDEERLAWDSSFEQLAGKQFLVVVVDRTIDVTTLKLVLETTINNHTLIELAIVGPIQDLQ